MASSTHPDRQASQREPGYAVDIAPGQECTLAIDGDKQKYRSSVIGIEPYKFLIVRMPMVPGIQAKLTLGCGVTLRMEHHGTLWGFTCRALKVLTSPAPMLVLAYPSAAERLQLRLHRRTPCFMPARVANEYLAVGGLVTDISLGGCRMVLDVHTPEKVLNIMRGDELALTLPTDAEETCRLEATVQNHHEVKGYRSLGLSFLRDSNLDDTVLARFVERMEGARQVLEQDG